MIVSERRHFRRGDCRMLRHWRILLLGVPIALFALLLSSQRPFAQGDSATKASESTGNKQQKETWWERAADPIAIFTLGLVIIGGAQLAFFYWQLRFIRESLDDAKQAADSTTSAAAAATRQAKVAEDSLTKLERPYIFIFNISELETKEYVDDAGPTGDDLLSVTYSVANYGKIPAIIKYAQAGMTIGATPDSPNRLHEGHTLIAAPILAAGEVRQKIPEQYIWAGGSEFDQDGYVIPTIPPGSVLFLWIIVTYRGPFTDQHETRACWMYNESTGRFNGPWGTADYSGEK
jgi:hypothetical protein